MDHGAGVREPLVYRPDIDGLRAICVVAVVLFHAGVPGFSGGYVGVDVFFVISGYLITLLFAASAGEPLGRRLTHFYIRRARRILPALFAVLIVGTVVAVVLLLPSDLVRYGKNLALTSVLLSNVAAWTDGGYFEARGAYNPLLHLWSIAVEEQFYLVYPLVLFIGSRYLRGHLTGLLTALAVGSLALCVWGSFNKPSVNFYFAPFRGWELLLGALLAVGAARRVRSRSADEFLAAASLIVLASAVYLYEPTMRYPGLYALAPCLAAAGLIAAGRARRTLTGRLLSSRPLVFTGLISYSLYLWHVPILTFCTYYNIQPLSAVQCASLLVAVYLTAIASWILIEKPIRRRAVLKSSRAFLMAAGCATLAIGASGVLLWESDGFPWRFAPDVRLLSESDVLHKDAQRCMTLSLSQIESGELCRYGPTEGDAPTVVVWGDSHALALLPAYESLAALDQVHLYFAAHSACRPLLGVASRSSNERAAEACSNFNAAMVRAIRRLHPAVVVLNARWTYPDLDLVAQADLSTPPGDSNFSRGLQETVQKLRGVNPAICVVLDVPVAQYSVPYALAMAHRRGISADFLTVRRADALEESSSVGRDVRKLQERGSLFTVDPKDVLCRTDICELQAAGRSLYYDSDHLSATGARYVSSTLEGCLRSIH
jgi:peptidoglycan/LPS O-acetylase OafA/YrhL